MLPRSFPMRYVYSLNGQYKFCSSKRSKLEIATGPKLHFDVAVATIEAMLVRQNTKEPIEKEPIEVTFGQINS